MVKNEKELCTSCSRCTKSSMLGHKLYPVHNALKKFENAALFLRFGLPSTRSFSKTLFKLKEFEFVWKENILKTRLFKNDDVTIITWFPCPSFPQTNPKWPVIGAFLSSSGAVWTEHIWWVFRIKPLFSNPYGVVCVERAFQSGKSEAVLTVWNFSFLEKHSKHNLYHKDLW